MPEPMTARLAKTLKITFIFQIFQHAESFSFYGSFKKPAAAANFSAFGSGAAVARKPSSLIHALRTKLMNNPFWTGAWPPMPGAARGS